MAYFIHTLQKSDMMVRECGMHIYSWQQQHFFALGLELQILVKLMQFCVTPLWHLRCIWASEDGERRHFNLFCLMKKTCQLMPSKNVIWHELAYDDSSNISCVSRRCLRFSLTDRCCVLMSVYPLLPTTSISLKPATKLWLINTVWCKVGKINLFPVTLQSALSLKGLSTIENEIIIIKSISLMCSLKLQTD